MLYYKLNGHILYKNYYNKPIGSYLAHETGLVFEVVSKDAMVCVSAFLLDPVNLSISNRLFFTDGALERTKMYLNKKKEQLEEADEFELLMQVNEFQKSIQIK
jgi:hypothetical protein